MNKHILTLAVIAALGVSGCSTTKNVTAPGSAPVASEDRGPIKDRLISTAFKDEGIRITYTMTGDIERILVSGSAPAWKGNHTILAEMDAMEKLVQFVHGRSVSTERRQRIIAESIDRASDTSRTGLNDPELTFESTELEAAETTANDTSVARRNAQRVEKTMVNVVTTITSSGRLTAVRKVDDSVSRDGRYYTAYFEWSPKAQNAASFMRSLMQ